MTPPATAAAARRAVPAPRPRRSPAAQASRQSARAAAQAARASARSRQTGAFSIAPRPVALGPLPVAVGRTAGAVLRLPELNLIHRLTAGRWWIGVLAALLAGIVAVNVFTLSLSSISGERAQRIEALQSSNSTLASRLARRTSADALQKRALEIGMVVPEPGDIRYLSPRGKRDLRVAAQRLGAPPVSGLPASQGAPVSAQSPLGQATAPPAQQPVTPSPVTGTATPAPTPQPANPAPAAQATTPAGTAAAGGTAAP